MIELRTSDFISGSCSKYVISLCIACGIIRAKVSLRSISFPCVGLSGNRNFPGGPGVKNPPSRAGDAGSILSQGTKTSYASGQLNKRTAIQDPTTKTRHNQK